MAPKKRPARKRRNPVPSQDESGKTPDAITGITERKQMEEALRQSEQRYRRLFEDSRDAIFITSRSGRFLAINQAAADLLGYTREELLELDVEKLYADSADRHRFQQQIEREGSVADYEVRLRRQDGTELECLLTSSVWWDEDGGITG